MSPRHFALPGLLALISGLLVLFGSPAQAADKDCGDFDTQKAAQIFFLKHGGPQKDPHRLDAEGDGVACESNPCPCFYGKKLKGDGGNSSKKKVLRQRAEVLRIIDGDTIEVRLLPKGGTRDVRILGIDTPEVFGGGECGGPEASRSMSRLLKPGMKVRMASDPTQDKKDRFDRLLRYVHKLNGIDVGRAQVKRGLAKVYVFDRPFQRVKAYRGAQKRAKQNDRGIWGFC